MVLRHEEDFLALSPICPPTLFRPFDDCTSESLPFQNVDLDFGPPNRGLSGESLSQRVNSRGPCKICKPPRLPISSLVFPFLDDLLFYQGNLKMLTTAKLSPKENLKTSQANRNNQEIKDTPRSEMLTYRSVIIRNSVREN